MRVGKFRLTCDMTNGKPTNNEQNYKRSFLHGISTVTKDEVDGPLCRACAPTITVAIILG